MSQMNLQADYSESGEDFLGDVIVDHSEMAPEIHDAVLKEGFTFLDAQQKHAFNHIFVAVKTGKV